MHLLIIDPQNDFMDLDARSTLPVTGAANDMSRLADLIDKLGDRITDMTITLDSHHYVGIERTTFWRMPDGNFVDPYTTITLDDVRALTYEPADRYLQVTKYLATLESGGRYKLMVWPVHCELGTWGHNVYEPLMTAINAWELRHARHARKIVKGLNPWTEQYSAFCAEVPDPTDPATQMNWPLLATLAEGDRVLVAGEASSHCVRASVNDMLRLVDPKRLVLLRDCMSPVKGYNAETQAFFGLTMGKGAKLLTAKEAANVLPAI